MISKTHDHFWRCFQTLPKAIQKLAENKIELWRAEPFNTSLHFNELVSDVWSVRINQNYRALGRRRGNLLVWFWIGSHREYDELVKRLK